MDDDYTVSPETSERLRRAADLIEGLGDREATTGTILLPDALDGVEQEGEWTGIDMATTCILALGNCPEPEPMADDERYPLAAMMLGMPIAEAMHLLQPVPLRASGGMDREMWIKPAFGRLEYDTPCEPHEGLTPADTAHSFRQVADGHPPWRAWF